MNKGIVLLIVVIFMALLSFTLLNSKKAEAQTLIVWTDKYVYEQGETVTIFLLSEPNSTIRLVLLNSDNITLWSLTVETNASGEAELTYNLPPDAAPGYYNLTAFLDMHNSSTTFKVIEKVTIIDADVSVEPPVSKAYPGQTVEINITIKNTGNVAETACLTANLTSLLLRGESCTTLLPDESKSVVVGLNIPLNASPGKYYINVYLHLAEVHGEKESSRKIASYPLIIPETNVNVTFNFRLPSGVSLEGKVFLNGKPVGSTNAMGCLSLKLVGNLFYNIKFEKDIEEASISYQKRIWIGLAEQQTINFTVKPSKACLTAKLVAEPAQVEQGQIFEILSRYAIAPKESQTNYTVYLQAEWLSEPILLDKGSIKNIVVKTVDYSLNAPDKPGIYTIKLLIEADGETCYNAINVQVLRSREGCLQIHIFYLDGKPVSNSIITIGEYTAVTGANGSLTICGLKEGNHKVAVKDSSGEYRGEGTFHVNAFKTKTVSIYLKPTGPCIQIVDTKLPETPTRYTDWSITAELIFRRCSINPPLDTTLRVGSYNTTTTLENLTYDTKIAVKFVVPYWDTPIFTPGEEYNVYIEMKEPQEALKEVQIGSIKVQDEIGSILASSFSHGDPTTFTLYLLVAFDITGLALLLLFYGEKGHIPYLNILFTPYKKAEKIVKPIILAAAAIIIFYGIVQALNALINNEWFLQFSTYTPLNIAALFVIALGESHGLAKFITPTLKKGAKILKSLKRRTRQKKSK
ncbi:MAG: hypothetical protein J7J67_02255 [Thermoproteales archaeon]|nr:hypothetical protein [Thermoproteales archaeon]